MSTKTSFKRIALVAASALAIAGFSAVPANAAGEIANGQANGGLTALTLANLTAAPVVGTPVHIKMGGTFNAITGDITATGVHTLQAAITTYPASGSVAITSELAAAMVPTTAATVYAVTAGVTPTIAAATGGVVTITQTNALTTAVAQTLTNIAGYTFTPTKAGTYVVTVWQNTNGTGNTPDLGEVLQTVSITVAEAPGFSSALSTAFLGSAGNVRTTAATEDAGVTFVNTLAGIGGNVNIVIKDSLGATQAGNVVTATISGAGFVNCAAQNTVPAHAATRVSTATTLANGFANCAMSADGTSGLSTVTISVTNAAGVTSTLATKSVTFFGAVTAITAVGNLTVLSSGGATTPLNLGGVYATLGVRDGAADIPAAIVTTKDANGNLANIAGAAVPTGLSSNVNVVSSALCVLDDGALPTTFSSGAGTGIYNCSITTATSAKSGDTATVTFRTPNPADATGATFLSAAAITVTVGGTVATETLSLDADSYSPGAPILVTRTAVDSSGNPVADGIASPAVSGSKALGGAAIGAGTYVGGKSLSSTTLATAATFAPATGGDFMITATSSATGTPTISASATVEDANGSLALDAANAATDAAENAYDEAQNATQAASDALAAVTALGKQVTKLIAQVKKLAKAVSKL